MSKNLIVTLSECEGSSAGASVTPFTLRGDVPSASKVFKLFLIITEKQKISVAFVSLWLVFFRMNFFPARPGDQNMQRERDQPHNGEQPLEQVIVILPLAL
jgi:hypothetical protein